MSRIERTITVHWRHQVHFTHGVFAPPNHLLREVLAGTAPYRVKVLMVVDESLAVARPGLLAEIQAYFAAHQQVLDLVCPPLVMEGGERIKNAYFHVSEIHSHIERFHIDRQNYVLCVGGGALLDMAGLAAATAHRGVRHVRLPSTTLAQADSGVGVKNGINAFGKKNFIGTFTPPHAVINDFALLESLAPRDKRAGYVEAVKVACIKDRDFFEEITRQAAALRQFESAPMQRLIRRCAELHIDHIATSGDPFEFGAARPLDFGHWSAHKLEQLSEYRLRHGEAVAVGIALDVIYSREIGLLAAASSERILQLLRDLNFELFANELGHADSSGQLMILRGLEEFREHLGGELTITLLKEIGQGVETHEMDPAIIGRAIKELANFDCLKDGGGK
jgi:3-dehydroquinate synthase